MAMSGWSERSSLPPKPPPQALGMTRTRLSGSPRMRASSSRSMYGVWVVAKTSTRPSTRRAVPASGSMYACSTQVVSNVPVAVAAATARSPSGSARRTTPSTSTLPGRRLVQAGRRGIERRVDPEQRRQGLPLDRQLVVGDGGHGRGVADERQHRLAAEAHVALGEDRLVLAGRRRSRTGCCPGTSSAVRIADEARVTGEDRAEVPDPEPGMRVRRPDRAQAPGAVGGQVVAEPLAAGHLLHAVGAGHARAHGGAGLRDGRLRPLARPDRHDRLDDRGVARCTGTGPRRGRRGPRPSSGSASGRGGRPPPSASPACRRRTGRRRRRGTRPGAATARRRPPGPRPSRRAAPRPGPRRRGRHRPAPRRAARCTRRSRRRCSPPWCRSGRGPRAGRRRGGAGRRCGPRRRRR